MFFFGTYLCLHIFLKVANLFPASETKEVEERRLWMYLLLQHCGVSMISISYAVTSSAGKGCVACVENFQVFCFPDRAGFWLNQRTFAAGPSLSLPLPQKMCGLGGSWAGSDGLFSSPRLTISAMQQHQRSAGPFEFCCQLYFL